MREEVFDLVKDSSSQWNELGRELRVTMNSRDSLDRDRSLTDDVRLEKVLDFWINGERKQVTWQVIINALEKIRRTDLAKKVHKYLDQQNTYPKVINEDKPIKPEAIKTEPRHVQSWPFPDWTWQASVFIAVISVIVIIIFFLWS